jgi:hypothetical protein
MYVPGLFQMDVAATRARLEHAELVIGDVRETVPEFLSRGPAPIGFAAFDFGSYTGTLAGLGFLDAAPELLLPRVHCYFGCSLGFTYGDCVGERAAIHEYNARSPLRQISPIYGLRHFVPRRFKNESWPDRYHMAHLMDHPLYGTHDRFLRHTSESYPAGAFTSRA